MKTKKDLRPLIDGDTITYRCGFAADGQIKREAKQAHPGITDEELKEILLDTDYTSYALQNVRSVLEEVTNEFNSEFKLYVHLGGNYREQLATLKPYKGNRDPNNKPKYYEQMKEYMFEHWNAIPVRGMESDDAIGIEQFDNPDKYTVIVSNDKDMHTVPGWHYNWVRKELIYQPIKSANNFLFWQMLVGDPVDNIPGINQVGVKTATAILEEHQHNTDRIREAVKSLYQKQYGTEWERYYQEVGNLLYILRHPSHRDTGCPIL